MEKKCYILQAEVINSRAGDEFILLNPAVGKAGYYKNGDINEDCWMPVVVENNPNLFKKKENPDLFYINVVRGYVVYRICGEEYDHQISKERLAEIFVSEQKGELFIDTKEDREKRNADSVRKYTEEELLDFGDTCFKAAREKDHLREPGLLIPPDRYYDFADFKISYLLKKKNGNKH